MYVAHIHYSDNDHASQLTLHGVSMPLRRIKKKQKKKVTTYHVWNRITNYCAFYCLM